MNRRMTDLASVGALALGFALSAGPAEAQTTLKWAHVYETSEPFHTESVWAAQEIEKRTDGRYHVGYKDIQDVALLALRHRVILNFEAEADRVDGDALVRQVLELTPREPVKA